MNEYNNEQFSDSEYAYEVGLYQVEKLAEERGGIVSIVNERGTAMATSEEDDFAVLCTLLVQLERKTSEGVQFDDTNNLTAKAALKGAMTALLVAEAAFGDTITTKQFLSAIDITKEVNSGDESSKDAVNKRLVHLGHAGIQKMVSAEELISKWEIAFVDDLSYHHCYRLGFGLVMGSALEAVHNRHLDSLRKELDSADIDWDQAFKDMQRPEA